MSAEAIARVRELATSIESFDEPATIRRAEELEGVAERIASCAADLVDVEESQRVQYRMTVAAKSVEAARKAARAYQRNPLTRPLSQARFALNMGKAKGGLLGVLEILEGPRGGADADSDSADSSS